MMKERDGGVCSIRKPMSFFTDSIHRLLIIVLVIGSLLGALTLLKFFLSGFAGGESRDEYRLKRSLFSAAERSFLGVLELIDLGDLSLSYKVRLADIFDVKKGYSRSRWQSAFNRISAKHIDFILIQKSDGKPILGIELDDKSHQRSKRVERDKFVDGVFKSSGLPLLRIKVQATYNPQLVKSQIEEAINVSELRPDSPR